MVSALRVASSYVSAAIEKTNPFNKPSEKEETSQALKERAKEVQEKTKAIKELGKVQKEFEKAQKNLPIKLSQDPNDDPQELFNQALPLLRRMGINNLVDRGRTELIPGRTEGENSLYKIVLRRNAELDNDAISRINRQKDNLETIHWTAQAIEVYVWWPYKAAEEEIPEAVPA